MLNGKLQGEHRNQHADECQLDQLAEHGGIKREQLVQVFPADPSRDNQEQEEPDAQNIHGAVLAVAVQSSRAEHVDPASDPGDRGQGNALMQIDKTDLGRDPQRETHKNQGHQ